MLRLSSEQHRLYCVLSEGYTHSQDSRFTLTLDVVCGPSLVPGLDGVQGLEKQSVNSAQLYLHGSTFAKRTFHRFYRSKPLLVVLSNPPAPPAFPAQINIICCLPNLNVHNQVLCG